MYIAEINFMINYIKIFFFKNIFLFNLMFPINKSILNINSLANKTVIITGGATGLGKKMAEHFVSNNVNTIICSRRKENLEKTTNEINKKFNSNLLNYYQVDVTNNDNINDFYQKLQNENINPDILINNAAGNFISRTEDLSINAFNKIIDIVLKGTINMTLPFSKNIMNQQKIGNVINISTLYADTGSGFVVPSAIAKSGINAFTKSIASEWGSKGIRINGVAPGSIYTEGAFSRLDPTGVFKKKLIDVNPSGRLGEQEELANFILYLASDYSNFLNGQIINFDGGEGLFRSGQFNQLKFLQDDFWKKIKNI